MRLFGSAQKQVARRQDDHDEAPVVGLLSLAALQLGTPALQMG